MKKEKISLFAALMVSASAASAGNLYQIDDGLLGPAWTMTNGDTTWANRFTAMPGANVIDTIQIVFGFGGSTNWNGTSVTVKLWSDPNNDGNPNDALLLTSVVGTIANAGTDTFNVFDIPDTAVSGNFFVGATVVYDPFEFGYQILNYPAQADQTGSGTDSWIWSGSDSYRMSDLNAHTFLIRATSVPEPASLALFGLGLAGLAAIRRRKFVS